MKPKCYLTVAVEYQTGMPVDRAKLAKSLRILRNGRGFVFRLRPGNYRAIANNSDLVFLISTRG